MSWEHTFLNTKVFTNAVMKKGRIETQKKKKT